MTGQPPSALTAARRLSWWWVVAVVAGIGMVVASFGEVRVGGYLLAAACLAGGVIRGMRPLGRAGGLAVRRRSVDVVLWIGLGLVVAVAFTLVQL